MLKSRAVNVLPSAICRAFVLSSIFLAGALGCTPADSTGSSGTGGASKSGTGGAVGSGGATSGSGGATSGSGGAPDGSGGMVSSSGGAAVGSGGAPDGSGGADVGTGGSATTGSGGLGGSSATGGAAGGSTGIGGSTTAGGGASGSDCSTSTFKLCDDFEGGPLGSGTSPWKTTMSGSGYVAALVTDQVHSGTHAAHVAAPTNTGSAMIQETNSCPATDFWGRVWLRFKAPTGGHQMFIELNSANDQIRLLNQIGSNKIQVNLKSTDKSIASATVLPAETWFCYEWHIAPNSINMYVNGKQLTDVSATFGTSNLTSMGIGYQRFQAGTTAGEIWIDDVAINTSQIGCN